MGLHLDGERVIFTAGSKGIGLTVASKAFAAEGAEVAIIHSPACGYASALIFFK